MVGPLYMGIDPDSRTPALAAVDGTGDLVLVACEHLKMERSSPELINALLRGWVEMEAELLPDDLVIASVAVEGQEIVYSARSGANPRSILLLGQVAGMLMAQALRVSDIVLCPRPALWKGGVPKHIHQARILKRVGYTPDVKGGKSKYCAPRESVKSVIGARGLLDSDWKHVCDAIGLALWAKEKAP